MSLLAFLRAYKASVANDILRDARHQILTERESYVCTAIDNANLGYGLVKKVLLTPLIFWVKERLRYEVSVAIDHHHTLDEYVLAEYADHPYWGFGKNFRVQLRSFRFLWIAETMNEIHQTSKLQFLPFDKVFTMIAKEKKCR